MALIARHQDKPVADTKDAQGAEVSTDPQIEAGKLRLASLRRVAGIWADRIDIPADGLQYERELRNEWQ
ncbi:MAG TPA: hypothetical protein VFS02_16140 [Telluria sp.]|nr:hypothetical protein [Telluria sp.]